MIANELSTSGTTYIPHSAFTLYVLLEGIATEAYAVWFIGALRARRGVDTATDQEAMAWALANWLRSQRAFSARHSTWMDPFDLMLRWHAVSISMLVDLSQMEACAAAGLSLEATRGTSDGLGRLREWVTTPMARRAVVHAAAIRRLFDCKPRSLTPALHTPPSLYVASMILLVYVILAAPDVQLETASEPASLALDRADELDFVDLGLVGVPRNSATTEIEPRSVQSPQSDGSDSGRDSITRAASHFIRRGGTPTLDGISLFDILDVSVISPTSALFGRVLTHRMRQALSALVQIRLRDTELNMH
jgi:hypothetical protein